MEKLNKNLIIIGEGELAEIAYEYFTHDSPYTVIAFSIEKDYLTKSELFDLPIIPFEELEKIYPPSKFVAFVAIAYSKLNRVRTRLYQKVKEKGYSLVSYVSSKAFVWHNVEIGENCFIFENNVIQYHVKIGNNVILWSGNHIGHRSQIHDNCFISSHVVISGSCDIGESSFLGVNSCLNDKIKIGNDCVIGSGAVIIKDTDPGKVYVGNPAKFISKSSYEAFEISED